MFSSAAAQIDGTQYADDVFSTYLYTGNGSTQTITNGIDLAGKGGLVWVKKRDSTGGVDSNYLIDTDRGVSSGLISNSTVAQITSPAYLSSFNSNGFSLTSANAVNYSSAAYASWTFRKAARFFDCGTYTGDGVAGRTVHHNLGAVPGMIIVKMVDGADVWGVYHRSLGNTQQIQLQSTGTPFTSSGYWNNTDPTATQFTVGTSASVNTSGKTYVYYAFAHDTTTDGLIQCGSFTTDGSGNATVTLGWEPQYLMVKRTDSTSDWVTVDMMRGLTVGGTDASLFPNLSSAEVTSNNYLEPLATGFRTGTNWFALSATYIYLAIRRPNKPPTSGTQVYNAIARTGTGAAATVTGVGFAPDMVWFDNKGGSDNSCFDRLRGDATLQQDNTGAEAGSQLGNLFGSNMDGLYLNGPQITNALYNATSNNYINWFFRRAPGVFDVVCYTGTGVARTVNHSLGVAPEMMIAKERSAAGNNWIVYHASLGNTNILRLDFASAAVTAGNWNNTTPTASVFSVSTAANVNANGSTYVWYGFATKPGISYVGSYTGNGSSQTINCGFTTGARFVMIKRTDSTGDWYVWDSTRGIVAGNDPHLSLNTTAAEVTTDDSVDTDTSGFIVNQLAATNVNVTSATYIVLALA